MRIEEQKDLAPKVSIIIVNYNGIKIISQCLSSVLKSNYHNFEVIMVDNGSSDGSVELVDRVFEDDSKLQMIRLATNFGYALANNEGVSVTTGEYIVFLNNDTTVEQNWLIELVKVMNQDQEVGACQSKLLLQSHSNILDGCGDFLTVHGLPFIRGHKDQDSDYSFVEEIFSARGACLMVRRSAINKVGAFDPSYFAGGEDVDLCWRLRLAGYKIVFVPNSVVYHLGSITSKKIRSNVAFHKHKNCIVTAIKNYNIGNLLKKSSLLILFRLILSFLPLSELEGNFGPGPEGIKALIWVIRNFREIYKQRLIVQVRIRKVQDSEITSLMPDFRFEVSLLKWFVIRNRNHNIWEFMHTQFKSWSRHA